MRPHGSLAWKGTYWCWTAKWAADHLSKIEPPTTLIFYKEGLPALIWSSFHQDVDKGTTPSRGTRQKWHLASQTGDSPAPCSFGWNVSWQLAFRTFTICCIQLGGSRHFPRLGLHLKTMLQPSPAQPRLFSRPLGKLSRFLAGLWQCRIDRPKLTKVWKSLSQASRVSPVA